MLNFLLVIFLINYLDIFYAAAGEVDDCAEEEAVHEELHDAVGVACNEEGRRRDALPAKSNNVNNSLSNQKSKLIVIK